MDGDYEKLIKQKLNYVKQLYEIIRPLALPYQIRFNIGHSRLTDHDNNRGTSKFAE